MSVGAPYVFTAYVREVVYTCGSRGACVCQLVRLVPRTGDRGVRM